MLELAGVGGITAERLRYIDKQIGRLRGRKSLGDDNRDSYLEARNAGFDVGAPRRAISIGKQECADMVELQNPVHKCDTLPYWVIKTLNIIAGNCEPAMLCARTALLIRRSLIGEGSIYKIGPNPKYRQGHAGAVQPRQPLGRGSVARPTASPRPDERLSMDQFTPFTEPAPEPLDGGTHIGNRRGELEGLVAAVQCVEIWLSPRPGWRRYCVPVGVAEGILQKVGRLLHGPVFDIGDAKPLPAQFGLAKLPEGTSTTETVEASHGR